MKIKSIVAKFIKWVLFYLLFLAGASFTVLAMLVSPTGGSQEPILVASSKEWIQIACSLLFISLSFVVISWSVRLFKWFEVQQGA